MIKFIRLFTCAVFTFGVDFNFPSCVSVYVMPVNHKVKGQTTDAVHISDPSMFVKNKSSLQAA